MRTIPACNAARRDLLHIINFSLRFVHSSAGCRCIHNARRSKHNFFKCLFSHCVSGNKTSLDEYISSYYSLFFETRFGLVPGGLSWIHTAC